MGERALRVIDGEVRTHACDSCQDLEARLAGALKTVTDLEKDLRGKRARITALLADAAQARKDDPQRALIRQLFEFWQKRCEKPRAKLSGDRFDALKERLAEGYSPRDLALCIAGIAAQPWRPKGSPESNYELAWYMAKGSRVEQWANKGARARRRT